MITIFAFLTLLAVTLAFGAWLATRWQRAGTGIDTVISNARREWEICDAADMATDGDERQVSL